MSNVARTALPGYNALTDTDPDHFSLYADEDNVLIKRKQTGSGTISAGAPTTETIAHDLTYISFFMVYFDEFDDGSFKILNNQYNPIEVPSIVCATNTTDLIIKSFITSDYAYDIFYDDMDTEGVPEITESNNVFKVARPNKSANSKNPNDYIVHSDLNNFKILKQGTTSITLEPGTNSFNHIANVQAPYKYFMFCKFPDGKTALLGGSAPTYSYDGNYLINSTWCDATKLYISLAGASNIDVDISYIIYGSGKDNTVTNSDAIIACSKDGINVLTANNPDSFNFHSDYPTLKYHQSGTYQMTVNDNTVYTIAHNLKYTPFFIGFVNDFEGNLFTTSSFAIMPYYLGRSTFLAPLEDIGAFIYADDTNIYLKSYYQTNAIGDTKTFTFYHKIFKNNLGI